MREVVIVEGCRTAAGRAKKNGSLLETRPDDLTAAVLKGCLERVPQIKPEDLDDIIIGCAMPEGEQGMNVARISMFRAQIPYSVPAMTVNRFCCSGIQTVSIAQNQIACGLSDIIIAGGVESMTMVPMGGQRPAPNPWLVENYPEAYTAMGITAELLAEKYNITRQECDEFAYNSHQKALKAIKEGKFKDEIVPVNAKLHVKENGKVTVKEFVFDTDECPREGPLEGYARLKPVFKQGGVVTAANSSPINDGAAAVVVMSKEVADKLGIKPIAKLLTYQVAGVPPEIMGIGPVEAIPKAFKKTGLTFDDMDIIELNEAFAAQSLAVIKELNLPLDKTNINGGAIALGHPLGCTGAKLLVQLLYEMKRRSDIKYALESMCIGGGMGAAGILQNLYHE